MPAMSITQIQECLAQHTGSDIVHKHLLFPIRYTAGVKHMAELCRAWWLVDAIASYQPRCMKDRMLKEMQFWSLRREKNGWALICYRDEGDEAFRQEIEFSDFPLDSIEIWVCNNTMLLPSEY